MENLILFDDRRRSELYPLTFTRPIAELRTGIFTNTERWHRLLLQRKTKAAAPYISWHTEEHLAQKYATRYHDINYIANAAVIATRSLLQAVERLQPASALVFNETELLAACLDKADTEYLLHHQKLPDHVEKIDWNKQKPLVLNKLWHIFQVNAAVLEIDFDIVKFDQQSQPISPTNIVLGDPSRVFISEGAVVEASVLNVKDAPIFVGRNAEIMEGCLVRGGLALCDGAQLKMGAKIYGATTVGQFSKVGGEVGNSVIQGFSNKGHDGYLGNSVLGEWCNLGAGTNNSNLKNNYGEVQLWNYNSNNFEHTGTQFCGLFMGDHSKCAISTTFNTGTVVGVSCNIFGDGFPRKFVPSFAWGGAKGFSTYELDKAFETAELVMQRRHLELNEIEKAILEAVFNKTAAYRTWDRNKG